MNYVQELINQINQIEEGNKTALDTLKNVSKDVKDINELFARIKELALLECNMFSNSELQQLGFERRSGGVSGYDYSENEEWVRLNKQIKSLQTAMQTAAKTGNSQLIEDTGEIVEAAKIKGYKKDSLIIKS